MKNAAIATDVQLSLFPEDGEERGVEELSSTESEKRESLMSQFLDRENLKRALKQVQSNRGSPGVDGMRVEELSGYLRDHWLGIKEELQAGRYRPSPVRRVKIPKGDGRERNLGIPTVLDRFIQQALAQVVQRCWEPKFHESSYGFRPGRSAHDALRAAQSAHRRGKSWLVDIDLETFFDVVDHGRLIQRLHCQVPELEVLRLINRYLKAPVEIEGKRQAVIRGLPQGGPLSPVLSNVVLDELDWELERRGHEFARYADDCQVYVGSEEAGQRVMANLSRYIEKHLRLKVNDSKSAVDRPWNRSFLGFTFTRREHRLKVSEKSLNRLQDRVRALSGRTRGHSVHQVIRDLRETLLGWKAYFDLAEVLSPLRELDKWVRRRLRSYHWKQWGRRRYRELRKRGVERQLCWDTTKSAHGPWRLSQSPALNVALPKRYFTNLGLPELAAR